MAKREAVAEITRITRDGAGKGTAYVVIDCEPMAFKLVVREVPSFGIMEGSRDMPVWLDRFGNRPPHNIEADLNQKYEAMVAWELDELCPGDSRGTEIQ